MSPSLPTFEVPLLCLAVHKCNTFCWAPKQEVRHLPVSCNVCKFLQSLFCKACEQIKAWRIMHLRFLFMHLSEATHTSEPPHCVYKTCLSESFLSVYSVYYTVYYTHTAVRYDDDKWTLTIFEICKVLSTQANIHHGFNLTRR